MAKVELDESKLLTEMMAPSEALSLSERIAWVSSAPIRVTHLPTGLSAVGEGQGSQIKNKEKAVELLAEELTKRGLDE